MAELDIDDLIAGLYDAAIDNARWGGALPEGLSEAALRRVQKHLPTVARVREACLRARMGLREAMPTPAPAGGAAARPFGLSPAEFALALALGNGVTAREYAARNGVQISTVRTQIRATLAKTGVRRSTDVALLFAQMARR